MKKTLIILGALVLFFTFAYPAISADLKNEFLGVMLFIISITIKCIR